MTLTAGTLALVLLAALCHATWNALVKTGSDKLVMQTLVIGTGGVICVFALPFLPLPAAESWPYLIGSVVIHVVYFLFLTYAYAHGDLSQVYPIARGTAPALVALFAWITVGESLTAWEIAGLVIVSAGIMSLSRLTPLLLRKAVPLDGEVKAIVYALLTALCIGTYSLFDGLGGRTSGNVASYIAWLYVLCALPLAAITFWRRRGRIAVSFAPHLVTGIGGGLVASLAYAIIIWALSVAPMAHVVALRETSVIIAAYLGTRLLREPFGPQRVAAATVVACGAALLNFGG